VKILIAYASRSGSTREIAERIRAGLERQGHSVEAKPIAQVAALDSYDAVFAGGLLYRLGWHPEVLRFLRRERIALRSKRTAFFVTGLRLTPTPAIEREPYPVYVDPAIQKLPVRPGRLTLAEWFTTSPRYLGPVLPLLRELRPAGLAFFAGSLQLFSLSPFERLTALLLMALTGIQPGDHRSWEAVDGWCVSLAEAFST
jgi:menaquinone-dependent protoporphyrinogen IX oxidase